MPQDYTQDNQPMRIKTALGPDVLLLASFRGEEAMSRPFTYQLELLSTDHAIDPAGLLRKAATLTLVLQNDEERHISGIISRFSQQHSEGELSSYSAQLVPWTWFLSLSQDCCIYQNKSVLEIIEAVFGELGYTDFELRCTRSYPKREYCVQYRESHLDFISRLMEEEGIFYFFKHSDSGHVMVLADSNSTIAPCPGVSLGMLAPHSVRQEAVLGVSFEHAVHTGKVTLGEYDYLQPALSLVSTIEGDGQEERFDYLPVGYTQRDEGSRYARILLEAEEALHQTLRGVSSCRFLQSGYRFELDGHVRPAVNQEYTLLEISHAGRTDAYRTTGRGDFEYQNEFLAIPYSVPYRPQRRTRKPTVHGTQSAVVVGKAGEEIWLDSHGRVKIQFHWDRKGQKDENSSCWVRVSSSWAGKGWGAVHHPRMGQEVLVDFIEGDPDRPIIVGRVYNAEQTPPYALPGNSTQSGIKSRSSKSGGTENYNEIRMEDLKGSELLYIHAEKDKHVMVENDRVEDVKHDEKITVHHDRTEEVKNDENVKIGNNRVFEVVNDETVTIGNNRTEDVGSNETITIGGNRTEDVGGDEVITISGKREISIGSTESQSVGSSREVSIGSGDTLSVGSNLQVDASGKITMTANSQIELKVGGSVVKITPASIELKSSIIKLEAQGAIQIKAGGAVQVKAPAIMNKADGLVQIKGAVAQVNGDGVVMVKGGITMIN